MTASALEDTQRLRPWYIVSDGGKSTLTIPPPGLTLGEDARGHLELVRNANDGGLLRFEQQEGELWIRVLSRDFTLGVGARTVGDALQITATTRIDLPHSSLVVSDEWGAGASPDGRTLRLVRRPSIDRLRPEARPPRRERPEAPAVVPAPAVPAPQPEAVVPAPAPAVIAAVRGRPALPKARRDRSRESWPVTISACTMYVLGLCFSTPVATPVNDEHLDRSELASWETLTTASSESLVATVERLLSERAEADPETLQFATAVYRAVVTSRPFDTAAAQRLAELEEKLQSHP